MNGYLDISRRRITTIVNSNTFRMHSCLYSDRIFSSVEQDTFFSRYDTEKRIVKTYMPSNTRALITVEGVSGWSYSFYCLFGNKYTMFAYFDGSYYQVMVIEPVVEKRYRSAHTGHIFDSGHICFGTRYNNGRSTLQDAYSKSVLWATGMSSLMLTGNFQFSLNNMDDFPELPELDW